MYVFRLKQTLIDGLINSFRMGRITCVKTYAIRGISKTSPSMVTTSLSFTSFDSDVSNSTTAGTHSPGAIGLLGFFTLSWKYYQKEKFKCKYKLQRPVLHIHMHSRLWLCLLFIQHYLGFRSIESNALACFANVFYGHI